ncbi:MAG: anaerobic ribonucleoside-triphosphate reductase activating protein [Alphaproteobacteria bacterium]
MVDLRIGGFARLSTCDWPGKLAATIFCQGCPWSCPYCHNPHLIPAHGKEQHPWADILTTLEKRRGLLDGVVFSGGEPTSQKALLKAMQTVRAMGFNIGLHTGGPYPERLAAVLPLVDWVGFDIKAPFADYERITGVPGSGEKASASLRHLLASGVAYELRTTVHPALLDDAAMKQIRNELAALGAGNHVVQTFRPMGCANEELNAAASRNDDVRITGGGASLPSRICN